MSTSISRRPAARRTRTGRTLRGAPLLPPALAYAVLTVAAVVLPTAVAGEAPYSSDTALLDFYGSHPGAASLSALLLVGSAVPLAVAAAVASHRVRQAGLDVPGRVIALTGGTVAAAMLATSGLVTMALTRPHVADSPAVVRAFQGLAFATGGPGFVVFCGLLVAGISVPAMVGRLTPRWVSRAGLAVAVVCELGTLTVAFDALTPLLPVGRFGSMLWLVAAAVTLTGRRPRPRREEA